jgi:C_GCAxxG_C_C family probable redox protein
MEHSIKAAEYFIQGYNCAQAVYMAFADVTGETELDAAKASSSFGGGIGGLREVCGAFGGLTMVVGKLYGYTDPKDDAAKKKVYGIIQSMAEKFKAEAQSVICREILKVPAEGIILRPEEEKYYNIRPCARMVMLASRILDEYIAQNPVK